MKENSEFKPVKLRLKIDLMSYPARAEGLGKYDKGVATKDRQLQNHGPSQVKTKNKIEKVR